MHCIVGGSDGATVRPGGKPAIAEPRPRAQPPTTVRGSGIRGCPMPQIACLRFESATHDGLREAVELILDSRIAYEMGVLNETVIVHVIDVDDSVFEQPIT